MQRRRPRPSQIKHASMAKKVKEDVEKSRVEHQGNWLQNSVRFDQNFMLSSRKRTVADALFDNLMENYSGKIYKLDQKRSDFEVICANLLYRRQKQPISVSMTQKSWSPGRHRRTSYFAIEGINMLARNKLINMKKGYQYKNQSRLSRIWPTKEFIDLFAPLETEDIRFEPVDLVNLRNKEGDLIDYKDTKETKRVRDILRKVNTVNSQILTQFIIPDNGMGYRLETNLHAVYNGDFKHGGRLYTATRDGYQHLSGEERKSIRIDNKKTVELDFSGLHPRILYAWEGIQYDDDPYSILPDDLEMRQVFKKIFMCLLNSKDEVTAVRAGNKFLYDNRKYYNRMRKRGLKIKDDLIPMFQETHAPIAHYFCKGTGLKVMNLDSKIALDVLKHFAEKCIPVLAIHDSFIVYRHLKQELKQVMQSAYGLKTKGFNCPVKGVIN